MRSKPPQLFKSNRIEEAIEFIKSHAPKDEPYYVGISGGKDSTVVADLVRRSEVPAKLFYSATGIDPPEIVHHIKRNYPHATILKPAFSFYKGIVEKGFPTKFNRWCCDVLKEKPSKGIPYKHRIMGIRAEESNKRAIKGRISKMGKWTIYKPIFFWLEWEIWDYIEENKLPYCKLYDEGFDRLGCVVCPFMCQDNQKNILRHKKRWPSIYKAFERAMYELWQKDCKTGDELSRYSTFDEMLQDWYLGRYKSVETEKKGGMLW